MADPRDPEDELLQGMKAIVAYLRSRGVGCSRSTLYEWIRKYGFPAAKGTILGLVAYRLEIEQWLKDAISRGARDHEDGDPDAG